MNNEEIEQALSEMVADFILSYAKGSDEKVWDFSLQGRKVWNVSLDFSFGFPHQLPLVKLLEKDDIGVLAHVNRKCTVCIEESDSIVINTDEPSRVIEYFLEETVEALDMASLKINQVELTDEYEGYFQYDAKATVHSFYSATDKLETVSLNIVPVKSGKLFQQNHLYNAPVLILDNRNTYPSEYSNVKKAISTNINIIHIPLQTAVLPPSHGRELTAAYIHTIAEDISEKNKKTLEKFLRKTKQKKEFFLLISMPRTEAERTQLLLHFTSAIDLYHPLKSYSDQWDIEFFTIQRNNKEYLLERGGAQNSLLDKKVVLVGCGSVGGEIAYMLAKAGVGELTLIDPEGLEVDNIYRHRLGGNSLSYTPNSKGIVRPFSKVATLQYSLHKDLPYIKVNAVEDDFEKIIDEEYIYNADLIVIATGLPSKNLQFNAALKERNIKHTVFCWNEAAGYGGHAVYINLDECCLECLYTDESKFTNSCKLNFLETGQNISKNLTGCAGAFTSFSYLDSSQTALLAASLSIQILLEQILTSKASSWKGRGNTLLKTTQRYEDSSLMNEVGIERVAYCKVCHGQ